MSLGTVLDVIIGLVFTYLLLGIIASGIQEIWVAIINKRGQELQRGIVNLLSGTGPFRIDDKVVNHSLISGLSPGARTPSYVPAQNFALALIETLRQGSQGPVFSEIQKTVSALPAGPARQSLTAFIADAAGDLDAFQKNIEKWFDDAMDRVTGIYKRYSQAFTLVFGLVAAIVFNVDSIRLAQTLWTNGPLREAAVKVAQQYADDKAKEVTAAAPKSGNQAGAGESQEGGKTDTAASSAPPPKKDPSAETRASIEKNMQDAAALLNKMPVGWVATAKESEGGTPPGAWELFRKRLIAPDLSGLWMIVGWAITALATSLGAPFWFDSLNNLLRLRNAGPKPKRSDAPAQSS